MNAIEAFQQKYLPNFYNSRYSARKMLVLSVKQKCLKDPGSLSLYELRIVLKVLEQFKLIKKDTKLQQKQKDLKIKIVESCIQSTICSLLPFAIRQFHTMRSVSKLGIMSMIFTSVNAAIMYPRFSDYIAQCRLLAQRDISGFNEGSELTKETI